VSHSYSNLLSPTFLINDTIQLFTSITPLFPYLLQKRSNELPLSAACQFIGNAISREAISLDSGPDAVWKKIIDNGLRYRNGEVQEWAAGAWGAVSGVVDVGEDVKR